MRDLPRKLTEDDLAALFEGHSRFVRRLADLDDPLQRAEDVLRSLPDDEVVEALNVHPRIGARRVSAASASEQGIDEDPAVGDELARLNEAYEQRFGFRFVVFVNRRSRREILDVLRRRLTRTRREELDSAIHDLVAIAMDRAAGM